MLPGGLANPSGDWPGSTRDSPMKHHTPTPTLKIQEVLFSEYLANRDEGLCSVF